MLIRVNKASVASAVLYLSFCGGRSCQLPAPYFQQVDVAVDLHCVNAAEVSDPVLVLQAVDTVDGDLEFSNITVNYHLPEKGTALAVVALGFPIFCFLCTEGQR